jgi:Ca2+-binding RTX toxin-like protein
MASQNQIQNIEIMGPFYPNDSVTINIDGIKKTVIMDDNTDNGSNIDNAKNQIDSLFGQFGGFSVVSSVIDEPNSATSHIDTQLKFNDFESHSISISFFDSGNGGNQSPLTSSISTIQEAIAPAEDPPGDGGGGESATPDPALELAPIPTATAGINGNDTSEQLNGTPGNDVAFGRRGADTIKGGAGDDVIYGNHNNDVIFGGEGSDKLFGGQNDGAMTGSPPAMRDGVESLYGGGGDDFIYGNHGSDILSGGAGADKIWGGQNDDTLMGNEGADTLWGNLGNDVLKGGSGDDVLDGGSGDDIAQFSGNESDYTITQSSNTVVVDNRSNSPDGIDILNNVEFLKFKDQTLDISILSPAPAPAPAPVPVPVPVPAPVPTESEGTKLTKASAKFTTPVDTDSSPKSRSGTTTTVATNGSGPSPNEASIFNFVDGGDKIRLVGFGFTSSGTPSVVGDQIGFGENGSIYLDNLADQVVVYLNGVGTEDYAKIVVTGVTTLDLTDFEFA